MIKKFFRLFIVAPLAFIREYFKSFVFIAIVLFLLSISAPSINIDANLARIYLRGPIFESDTFYNQIENLKKYPNLKGVLLIIDSPGGGLAQSVEIADMVRDLNAKMPVIAYVQGAMASGSYYAGMYAHKIIANRGSMIGSIGVIFSGYNAEKLFNNLGINAQSLKAGEYKEAGTFMRAWSENEKNYLQNLINKQYLMFINDVANARNLNPMDYHKFAEGKVFSANEALELRLIDMVGSQQNAIVALKELSGINDAIWVKDSAFDVYLKKISASAISQAYSIFSGIK